MSIIGKKPIEAIQGVDFSLPSSVYSRASYADVAELVDAVDSKSTSSNRVLVRVQSSAKKQKKEGKNLPFLSLSKVLSSLNQEDVGRERAQFLLIPTS